MENLIPVLVIGGIVGFLLWKNKDKIVQLSEKFKDRGQAPEVAAPYKVPDPPVSAAPVEVKPEYNGVGDPPSQEAWAKWRNSLSPMMRGFYPEVWKPIDKVPDKAPAPTDRLIRGLPLHPIIQSGATLTLPIENEATRLSIAPHAGGIGNTYALWITDSTGVVAGDPNKALGEVSSIQFLASSKARWANVRNLGQETPLFVQTN